MCLMGAMNNSPLITDWIMVVITAIYVIATVLILLANRKAVKAAKVEQLQSDCGDSNQRGQSNGADLRIYHHPRGAEVQSFSG